MRYTKKVKVNELKEKYKYVIGWGAGGEFSKYYDEGKKFLDYMVDSGEKGKCRIGKYVNGLKVIKPDEIPEAVRRSDAVIIVIFPNIEDEVLDSVHMFFSDNIDTIVARLIDYGDKKRSFSSNNEDVIMMNAIREMNITNFSYMDVGVCHPVVRNNTYLFYELGNYEGILVEPNVNMCRLIEEYRPSNKVINCGASSDRKISELKYYYDNNNPGLNTFSYEVAKSRNMLSSSLTIPVKNINDLIADNFKLYPDILDIDTEGMDYDILSAINFKEFPVRIICAETNGDRKFSDLLGAYGYKIYGETKENTIFILNRL